MLQAKRSYNSRLNPYGKVTVELRTKSGIIKERQQFTMDSLVANFWKQFYQIASFEGGVTSYDLVRFNGGTSSISLTSTSTSMLRIATNTADSYKGIVAGSGNTPVELNDFNLDTLIEFGTGAGQLSYSEPTVSLDKLNRSVMVGRVFANNSGASIDVREVGIGVNNSISDTTNPILLARDVLPATITVADTEELSVSYEMFLANGNRNLMVVLGQLTGDSYEYFEISGTLITSGMHQGGMSSTSTGLKGIMLGTGNTAVSITDRNLAGRITLGTGAGQLTATTCVTTPFILDNVAGTIEFDLVRTFTNMTPDPIVVEEMGIFGSASSTTVDSALKLMDRVVLPSPVTFAPSQSRTAKWFFRYSL